MDEHLENKGSAHHAVHHSKDSFEIPIGRIKNNIWMITSIVLAIALIVVLFLKFNGGGVTGSVSQEEAGGKLLTFLNQQVQGQGTVELISTEEEGGLYKITVNYLGQEIPVYMTKDGENVIPQMIPLDASANQDTTNTDSNPQPTEVPKSDKPNVELFVMSYCPYGTQMEKGILPVLSTLQDKINFTLRYTHFTLHGEKEDTENFRQLCIREEQPDKFLSYIQCTLNSTSATNIGDVDTCMKNLKIDTAKVDSCIDTKAADYYEVDSQLSQDYGVQGSPTLVINGVNVQTARSPSAILTSICSAFNNEPAECQEQLSTDSPSPGFGYNAGSGADSAAANCGV